MYGVRHRFGEDDPCPPRSVEQDCGLLSNLTFQWFNPLIVRAHLLPNNAALLREFNLSQWSHISLRGGKKERRKEGCFPERRKEGYFPERRKEGERKEGCFPERRKEGYSPEKCETRERS